MTAALFLISSERSFERQRDGELMWVKFGNYEGMSTAFILGKTRTNFRKSNLNFEKNKHTFRKGPFNLENNKVKFGKK